jgi:hypothetical protein
MADVDGQIQAIEAQQAELQKSSSIIIAQNLEQLTALQQQLEEDRSRLARQQRRTRGTPALNTADIEQQRGLEIEVNELRRRRDNARDANIQSDRRLGQIMTECDRLQHHLNTPAGTPYPCKSTRPSSAKAATPSERLERGLAAFGGLMMRAGPAGSAMRAGAGGACSARPSSAGSAVNLAASGGALADRMEQEREDAELAAAELRLARAQLRRDTYEHMAARLRAEKQSFDPRFAERYAELQRERKRVAQMRISQSEAVQAHANAEALRRKTEQRIALRQRKEKALLAEQQATLLSTQQSVLHFEVSRMSRSQSAIKLGQLRSSEADLGAAAAWSDPAFGAGAEAAGAAAAPTDPAQASRPDGPDGVGGSPITQSSFSAAPIDPADEQLHQAGETIRKEVGVLEPMDLIHKALEQLEARTGLEALEAQTHARLSELFEDSEQLSKRRDKSEAAAGLAAGRRLERLHDLVSSAEKELGRATAALSLSDSAVAAARQGVSALDTIASRGAEAVPAARGYTRAASALECESSALPSLLRAAADTIVTALAHAADELRQDSEALVAPSSPSTLVPAGLA